MKNILTIDTANEYLSLGISIAGVDHHYQAKIGNRQSEQLIPQIAELLQQSKSNLAQIELIAYNQGPGSFTGLRIGLSVALGLAYSINCKLLPIPMFALYASKKTANYKNLLVILDARLKQIYVAVICQQDNSYLLEPSVINPEDLVIWLAQNTQVEAKNTCVTGNGWSVYQENIAKAITANYHYVQQDYPQPETMLNLAKNEAFPTCDVFNAELLYIRNKVAMNLSEQLQSKQQ